MAVGLMEDEMHREELRSKWQQEWPVTFARNKIKELTGGMMCGRTVANLMCKGEGPQGAFYWGRKCMLSRDETIEWILSRCTFNKK